MFLTGPTCSAAWNGGISNRLGAPIPRDNGTTLRMSARTKSRSNRSDARMPVLIPMESLYYPSGTVGVRTLVLLLRPAHADHVLDTRVLEVICKRGSLGDGSRRRRMRCERVLSDTQCTRRIIQKGP